MEILEDIGEISVLLIEDNPGDQVIIQENLRESEDCHFSIKNCFSLSEGLKALETKNIDIILLDLWLPDSTGLNTLSEILKHETSIPIIVLTIDKSDITGLRAIKSGAQDYLAKDELYKRNLGNSIKYAINRKKLELKLKESLSLYENTFHFAAVGFAHISPDGIFTKVNKKFSEITGYRENELLGKSIFDLIYRDGIEDVQLNIEKLGSGDLPQQTFEKRFIHKNGWIIWANVTKTVIKSNNEIKYFFITIEDITTKIFLETELLAQKDLLDKVIKLLPVGVALIDGQGKIKSTNQKFEEIWSGSIYHDVNDLKKYKGWWANTGKQISPEEWASYRALKNKEVSLGEIIKIESFDGSRKTILNSAIPIIKADKVIYAVIVIEDITQLINIEERLKELITEKEILMKESNHRIKNNLQLITSFMNLQLSNVKDEQTRNILTDSTNRVTSISLLHDYLFKSSKLNVVNVQEYLYKIIDHIKVTLQTDSSKIKVSKDIDNFEINSGLAISLGLVVNEIITNAVKHAFKNQHEKIISLELKQKGDNILLVIRDNGIGMEKNIDFEKASTLGFQILHALVTQHKGTIEYNIKNGTEFLINLPLTNNT